jgi:hypothetical protein
VYVSLQEAFDSDEMNIDAGIPDKNAKVLTIKVNSLCIDLMVKAGLSVVKSKGCLYIH